jgi:hypothetical protein
LEGENSRPILPLSDADPMTLQRLSHRFRGRHNFESNFLIRIDFWAFAMAILDNVLIGARFLE